MPIEVANESEAEFSPGHDDPISQVINGPVRPTVLAYHEITRGMPSYRYALACQDFERHLQVAAQLQRKADSKASLVLSFDDGHISNYVRALPLLKKYSCKAIFFVVVGQMGKSQDFMTWAQLKELVALGHEVCAHGWSHRFLTGCSDPELHMELVRSKEELENRLSVRVEALSAPHGRWDNRVAAACAEAGYRRLYISTPWAPARRTDNIEIVGRLMVIRSMNSKRLVNWLTMGRAEAAVHRILHGFKGSLRYALGNSLYHRLWTRFAGWNGPNDA
jgi:peptidoglycan/xylan/chitin deacetylase (PgdA/CDA1 family)